MKVILKPGDTLIIEFADSDGQFQIDFDSTEFPNQVIVRETAGMPGNVVEGLGILHHEKFGEGVDDAQNGEVDCTKLLRVVALARERNYWTIRDSRDEFDGLKLAPRSGSPSSVSFDMILRGAMSVAGAPLGEWRVIRYKKEWALVGNEFTLVSVNSGGSREMPTELKDFRDFLNDAQKVDADA